MTEKNRWAEQVFTFLMCKTIDKAFRFSGGGLARKSVSECLASLDEGTGKLSREKVVDFCVCQVYTMTFYDEGYLKRWKVSHSFGKKALERFSRNSQSRRYYEDKWLMKHELSRALLLDLIQDRSHHPLAKFIYPKYEDITKRRLRGTRIGLYVCTTSTLMWTPFSPVCLKCTKQNECREITRQTYPELFRIRVEKYGKGGKR